MKRFAKKIISIFMAIGIYLMMFGKKIYALTPLYGLAKEPEQTLWEKITQKIFNPISILVVFIIGVIIYLFKSKNGKKNKIVILFSIIIAFAIIYYYYMYY